MTCYIQRRPAIFRDGKSAIPNCGVVFSWAWYLNSNRRAQLSPSHSVCFSIFKVYMQLAWGNNGQRGYPIMHSSSFHCVFYYLTKERDGSSFSLSFYLASIVDRRTPRSRLFKEKGICCQRWLNYKLRWSQSENNKAKFFSEQTRELIGCVYMVHQNVHPTRSVSVPFFSFFPNRPNGSFYLSPPTLPHPSGKWTKVNNVWPPYTFLPLFCSTV